MQNRTTVPVQRLSTLMIAAAMVLVGGCATVDPADPASSAAIDAKLPALVVGSPAPELKVEAWLKGTGTETFAKGQVYLVEFFATWCGPCFESMPHLSEMQEKYGDKLRVIAVSVREGDDSDTKYTDATRESVRAYVTKNDKRMRFVVGYDGGRKLARTTWTDAAEQDGVPTAFVIDGQGRIAYIGHPAVERCEQAIEQVLAGTFDLADASQKYTARIREERAFDAARKLFTDGKVDESLKQMDELVKASPKWARTVSFEKFQNLIAAARFDAAMDEAVRILDVHDVSSGALGLMTDRLLKLSGPQAERANQIALRAALRAVEKNTDNYPVPPANLAAVYWKLGKKEDAITWQRKALELAPEDAKKNFEPTLRTYEAGK
jgi:thiol-disulfide isomerase/thioredoxin